MWLSKMAAEKREGESPAVAQVTMGGSDTGVMSGAEARGVPVFSPGGYIWRPAAGESVLIVKCGNEVCAAGREMEEPPGEMEEGEVCIKAGRGALLWLKNSGEIVVSGNVKIEGSLTVNGNEIA